jgi:two-component system nitrate/nitrite sensor histidine kinase NarX
VQVQVLHVVQEALSNVRKHAQATQVVLTVDKGEAWRFTVEDDGTGFDSSVTLNETHVGRKIMQERAGRIGGTVAVKTAPGTGTRLTLTLPAHPVAGKAAPAPTEWSPPIQTLAAHE